MHSSRTPMMVTLFATQHKCQLLLPTYEDRVQAESRRVHVRKGKVTARKVSEVLNSVARLVRAVGVLVDALSKWIGQAILLLGESPGCYPGGSPPLWLAPLSPVHSATRLTTDLRKRGS